MNKATICNVIIVLAAAFTMLACFMLPNGLLNADTQAELFLYALGAFMFCCTIGAVLATMIDSFIENNF